MSVLVIAPRWQRTFRDGLTEAGSITEGWFIMVIVEERRSFVPAL
jgi:hypothetical protein